MTERSKLSKTMRIDLSSEEDQPAILSASAPRQIPSTGRYPAIRARPATGLPLSSALANADFQELFQSVYDGALITELSGHILDANARAIRFLQYEREQFRQLSVPNLLSGADDSLLETIAKTLLKDRFVLIQGYCIRRDGSTFPAEISTNLINLSGDHFLCFFIRDISVRVQAEEDRKRMLADLRRSNADLQEFAYVVSHDLQEPLRKIQTFSGMLEAKCGEQIPDEGHLCIERVLAAANRMQKLIHDLLSLSRISTRAQPFSSVHLNEIVQGVLSDLEVSIHETQARVEVGDLPVIDAEPVQMRQLFQNLIGNALKFRRPDVPPLVRVYPAEVQVDPSIGGQWCAIVVDDNGIGFDVRHEERIFRIFQRLHSRREYEGTGIGLAVCRKIVERHGGTIEARSDGANGATFIVSLPLRQNTKPV